MIVGHCDKETMPVMILGQNAGMSQYDVKLDIMLTYIYHIIMLNLTPY